MDSGNGFHENAREGLLPNVDVSTAFVTSQPITTWTETQVLAFLNLLRLPQVLYPDLYNGKQLAELKDHEIRQIALQAKVYHDKMYDPSDAASRLIAGLSAVKAGNDADLYKVISGKFSVAMDTTSHQNSNDFSMLVQSVDDAESDDEYELAAFPRLFEIPGKWALLLMGCILTGILVCLFAFAENLKSDDETVGDFRVLFLKYASIPITMVPFTYFHIWLALWMTFYPVFFVGCWQIPGTNIGFPFGWQGIVPFKSVKMAKMAVDMITNKLITVDEVFLRLDPDKCAEILRPHIAAQMERVIQKVLSEEAPRLWSALPGAAKQRIVADAAKDSPSVVKNLLKDLRSRLDECFDLEGMVIKVLLEDMEMCNDIFIKVSHKELAFIRNAGAWMGGIFGAAQMVLWIYFQDWWVLPLLGFIVGAGTNWLALLFIFRPIEPIYLCNKRYKLQGLFLQRQKQVSSLYARNISTKVMTPENLCGTLMNGPKKELVQRLAATHIAASFEKSVALLRSPPLSFAVKTVPQAEELIETVKKKITEAMCEELYPMMRNLEPYMGEAFDLNNTLKTRMSKLPFADFEGLMHPIFKEDEPKLILMGGVLGVALGLLQMRMF